MDEENQLAYWESILEFLNKHMIEKGNGVLIELDEENTFCKIMEEQGINQTTSRAAFHAVKIHFNEDNQKYLRNVRVQVTKHKNSQ